MRRSTRAKSRTPSVVARAGRRGPSASSSATSVGRHELERAGAHARLEVERRRARADLDGRAAAARSAPDERDRDLGPLDEPLEQHAVAVVERRHRRGGELGRVLDDRRGRARCLAPSVSRRAGSRAGSPRDAERRAGAHVPDGFGREDERRRASGARPPRGCPSRGPCRSRTGRSAAAIPCTRRRAPRTRAGSSRPHRLVRAAR